MKYVCLTFKQITWYGVFFQFHQMSSLVYLNINLCLEFASEAYRVFSYIVYIINKNGLQIQFSSFLKDIFAF